jgi:alkylation response protein AidB-like acyl-CoA dehydrogenase
MNLLPDEDQISVRDAARDVLTRHYGPEGAHRRADRREVDAETDPAWAVLAEGGWFALGLPEEAGGVGLTSIEESLVLIEAGRALAPLALPATMLAAHAAAVAPCAELRDQLVAGNRRAGFVWRSGEADVLAQSTGTSGLLLVIAPGAAELYDAEHTQDLGVVDGLDPAEPMCRRALPSEPTLGLRGAEADHLRTRTLLFAAAYTTGIAQAMLANAVSYAQEREAFGRPIGAFQAIKHRLATAAMNVEAADAQVAYAATAFAQGLGSADLDVSAAKVLAHKAAVEATSANIQVHGALGVSWEHDAHLYLVRTRLLEHVPSGPRAELDRLVKA